MTPINGQFVSGGQCVSALNESVLLFPFKRLDSGQSKYYNMRPKSFALGPLPWFPSDPCILSVSDSNPVGTATSLLSWTDGSTYREMGSFDSSFNYGTDACLPPSGKCFDSSSLACYAPARLTYRCYATLATNSSLSATSPAGTPATARTARRLLQDQTDELDTTAATTTAAPAATSSAAQAAVTSAQSTAPPSTTAATDSRASSSVDIICSDHPVSGTSAGGQVSDVALTIASNDLIASKGGVLATLSFRTSSGLPAGGSITLSYPTNFFSTDVVPTFVRSSVQGLVVSISGMSPRLVATTSGVAIGASDLMSITFGNFKMGPNPSQGTTGVRVSTSADTTPSVCVPSGSISAFSQVSNVSLIIDDKVRVAGAAGVSVTLSFVPTITIPPGGSVTLTYPSGFFASGITPYVNGAGSSSVLGFGAVYTPTQNSSVVFYTSGASINASSIFTITIRGLVIGGAIVNSSDSIMVSTSSDQANSVPVASGTIAPGAPAVNPDFVSMLEGTWSGVCSQFAAVISSSPADVFRSQVGLQCIPVVHRYNYTIVYANTSSNAPVVVYTRDAGYTEFLGTKYSTVSETGRRVLAAASNQFVLTLDGVNGASRCASVAISRSSMNTMLEYGSGTLGLSSSHQSCMPETLSVPQMACADKASYSYVCSLQRQLQAPFALPDNSPPVAAPSPYTNPYSFPTESPDSRFLPVLLSRAARAAVWAGGAQSLFVGGNFLRAGSSPYTNHIAQVILFICFFVSCFILLLILCRLCAHLMFCEAVFLTCCLSVDGRGILALGFWS
jgi:hypothetical protein